MNMKPVDVKLITYSDFNKENNEKDLKFKIGDFVRISKHKNVIAKSYSRSWSEDVFVIKKKLKGLSWTYLNGEEIAGTFSLKELQKTTKNSLELKKKSREIAISYMFNGKAIIIRLMAGWIKKT